MASVIVRSTGAHLPATAVDSTTVDARLGLAPGTVYARTGMRSRRYAGDESGSAMAAEAVRSALDAAGLRLGDVDLLVSASGVAERPIPCMASLIAARLGLVGAACYDVNATCLSFLVALDIVSAKIRLGEVGTAVIVSSDSASVGIDDLHLESAALFGDGAAAVVIQGDDREGPPPVVRLETFPEGVELTTVLGGGTALPAARHGPHNARDYLFRMDGPGVYRLARRVLAPFVERFAAHVGCPWPRLVERAARIVPHQASPAALPLMARHLGIPLAKVAINVDRVGNLVSASLPFTLHDERAGGRLRPGDEVLLIGTGAGLTLGAAWLRV